VRCQSRDPSCAERLLETRINTVWSTAWPRSEFWYSGNTVSMIPTARSPTSTRVRFGPRRRSRTQSVWLQRVLRQRSEAAQQREEATTPKMPIPPPSNRRAAFDAVDTTPVRRWRPRRRRSLRSSRSVCALTNGPRGMRYLPRQRCRREEQESPHGSRPTSTAAVDQ